MWRNLQQISSELDLGTVGVQKSLRLMFGQRGSTFVRMGQSLVHRVWENRTFSKIGAPMAQSVLLVSTNVFDRW